MNRKQIILFLVIPLLMLTACGGGEETVSQTAQYLPEQFPELDMTRINEIRTFTDTTLWEYINGAADLYLKYNFTEVATADYSKGNTEIVVDINRFKSSIDAFGLYSTFPRNNGTILDMGVEGFVSPPSLNFVKGDYLVKLVAFPDDEESQLAMINLAQELERRLPGATEYPARFGLFPVENRIPATNQYSAESFMGMQFLDQVYSYDYLFNSDTVTFFLTTDSTGEKYLQYSEYIENSGTLNEAPENLGLNSEYSFMYEDSFYGTIIAGLSERTLLGIINYSPAYDEFVTQWILSL